MSEIDDMVNVCSVHLGVLTPWEEQFINDMVKMVDEARELSTKQVETLERIYRKIQRRKL